MTMPHDDDDRQPVGLVEARVLTPELWPDLAAVFESTSGCDGCWCFNHHIAPGAADVRDDAAREAKRAYVEQGRASGIIGYLDGLPVGWCAVDRRRDIPGHDCVPPSGHDGPGAAWAIHCFFTQETARGRGVARAMLEAAITWLRGMGADSVEAFPSPPGSEPFFGGFGGPYTLYESVGFVFAKEFDENFCRVVLALD